MPNNLVFNRVAEQLQTLISGVDSTGQTQKILTDSDGRIQIGGVSLTAEIRPLSAATDSITIYGTVTVTAQNLDIRPLSAATDSITIYGTFTANTQFSGRTFTESSTSLSAVTDSAGIFIQNTSEQSLYSFYIYNTGSNTVTVQLQISPTTTSAYFMDDPSGSVGIGAGQKTTLITSRFLKYTRLFYETSGAACTFEVYYNAHI